MGDAAPVTPTVVNESGPELAGIAAAAAAAGADEIFLWLPSQYISPLPQIVRPLAAAVDVPCLVSAELSTPEEVEAMVGSGASRIFMEGAALSDPDLVSRLARRFGPESIGVTISALRDGSAWRVWDGADGRPTEWDAVDWARVMEAQGAGELLLRSAAAAPPNLELCCAVTSAVARPVMALLEGVAIEEALDALLIGDVDALLLDLSRVPGAESIAQIKSVMAEHGLPVRR